MSKLSANFVHQNPVTTAHIVKLKKFAFPGALTVDLRSEFEKCILGVKQSTSSSCLNNFHYVANILYKHIFQDAWVHELCRRFEFHERTTKDCLLGMRLSILLCFRPGGEWQWRSRRSYFLLAVRSSWKNHKGLSFRYATSILSCFRPGDLWQWTSRRSCFAPASLDQAGALDKMTLPEQMVLGLSQFSLFNDEVDTDVNDDRNALSSFSEGGIVDPYRSSEGQEMILSPQRYDKKPKACFFRQKKCGESWQFMQTSLMESQNPCWPQRIWATQWRYRCQESQGKQRKH